MKHLRITHKTDYYYREAVSFGPHRALVRPREGHDVHIENWSLDIEPRADVRWLRDIYNNSIAMITFSESAQKLRLSSEVVVAHYEVNPLNFLIEPYALSYPFQYSSQEQAELIPYRLFNYPGDDEVLRDWLSELYTPGGVINTFDMLSALNARIGQSFQYLPRSECGVQRPSHTIRLGAGSCRDYAVLMMEAARYWGFGARFVTGYVQLDEGQHGTTHAWTEIYIPGAGWRGFDPTNNKFAGAEHVCVAVACDPEKASPLSGQWYGPKEAFERMDVSVKVVSL